MKKRIVTAALLFPIPTLALAQNTNHRYRGQGYVFVAGVTAPGGTGTIHGGGGGEGFVYRGLGLGVEIGARGPITDFRNSVHGLGSANLSYHVLPETTNRKLEPFVTAGYAIAVRAGVVHGTNFGGGVNIWLKRPFALRFEVRDTVLLGDHQVGFRVGVTVR